MIFQAQVRHQTATRLGAPRNAEHQNLPRTIRQPNASCTEVPTSENTFRLTNHYSTVSEEDFHSGAAKNSHTELCIEEFLKKSEKEWFRRYRDAKLGRRDVSRARSPNGLGLKRPESRDGKSRNSSIVSRGRQRHRSITPHSTMTYMSTEAGSPSGPDVDDEFLLGNGYKAPTGLRK